MRTWLGDASHRIRQEVSSSQVFLLAFPGPDSTIQAALSPDGDGMVPRVDKAGTGPLGAFNKADEFRENA